MIEGPFTFDIEYKKDNWYPLVNGYLPEKDSQKHWSEFPKNTHIGARGPMIKWKDLVKLPNIHYEYDLK